MDQSYEHIPPSLSLSPLISRGRAPVLPFPYYPAKKTILYLSTETDSRELIMYLMKKCARAAKFPALLRFMQKPVKPRRIWQLFLRWELIWTVYARLEARVARLGAAKSPHINVKMQLMARG